MNTFCKMLNYERFETIKNALCLLLTIKLLKVLILKNYIVLHLLFYHYDQLRYRYITGVD